MFSNCYSITYAPLFQKFTCRGDATLTGGVVDLRGNTLSLSGTSRFFSNGQLNANLLTMGGVFDVCDSTDFLGNDQTTITTLTATGQVQLVDDHEINARGVVVSGNVVVDNLDIVNGWDSLTLTGSGSSLTYTPTSQFNIATTTIEGTLTSTHAMAEGQTHFLIVCFRLQKRTG